jgi:hypothetical protein
MNKKDSVSLVIIDTDTYQLARRAVEKTIQIFPVDEILIFSDDASKWGHPIIEVEKISSIADYQRILFDNLANYLQTDFALVIQYDGFAINPDSFSKFFYKFDFIGAPWPAGLIPGQAAMVGNGGFSLRSKRLIEVLANYRSIINYDFAEDATVCRFLRPMLESEGIVYAPVEVARHFSVEFEDVKNIEPFGFHGPHILPLVYRDDYKFLIENLPNRVFDNPHQLGNFKHGFSRISPEAQKIFFERVERQMVDSNVQHF